MRRMKMGALAAVLAVTTLLNPQSAGPEAESALAASVPLRDLIGQKLVVAMHGFTPSADLLGRISRGEVGGVILFGGNIRSAKQLNRLTAKLRRAASDGGQPPLLITTDQEGGGVKRLFWAPPALTPLQMGSIGSTEIAFDQGERTGHVLSCAGINGNLAPVADVPVSTASFLYQQGRTWSFQASTTAFLSDAFASGLRSGHDVPAMKHFPGLGRARHNTDSDVVTIGASKADLSGGLRPYRKAIGHHIPMVMLSNATYTAYDRVRAAGWSRAISHDLLRETLGFGGVSITDSLSGTADARGVSASSLAIKAAIAGTDMILLTGSESGSRAAYTALLNAARSGRIPVARLRSSYDRILAMKGAFPTRIADDTAPRVDAPAPSLVAGTTLGDGRALVRTSWSARDRCAVAAYALQRRTEFGAWTSQSLAGPLSTSQGAALRFGTRYRYRVTATDGAANASAHVMGPAFRLRRAQEDGSEIRYSGRWLRVHDDSASDAALAYSTADGARASFSFTGHSVSWVAVRGAARGKAAVYVDGKFAARIDLHSSTRKAKQVVFARSFADGGSHHMSIVNLGTAGHSRVDLDVLVTMAPA